MTDLLSAVPALALVVCALLLVVGVRLLRSEALEGLEVDDLVLLRPEQRRVARGPGPLDRLVQPFVPRLRSWLGVNVVAALERMVELAGRPQGVSVDGVLRRIGVWLVITFPAVVVGVVLGQWPVVFLCLAVSVFLPVAPLLRARRLRRAALDRDLPDFLDVLAVTVSAGVAFRPALGRVSERFTGVLSTEMELALNQIANGASVREAFVRLRERNESDAVASFVTAYLQAEELGAPLAQTLNQIADDMRRESGQRQRRKAAQVAPRVTLVTSLVLFPGALIIVGVGFVLGSGVDFDSLLNGGAAR